MEHKIELRKNELFSDTLLTQGQKPIVLFCSQSTLGYFEGGMRQIQKGDLDQSVNAKLEALSL